MHTNELANWDAVSEQTPGAWFNTEGPGDYILVQASVRGGGSVSINIEGRTDPLADPVFLTTFGTTDGDVVARFPQMRAVLDAGDNVTARVSTGSSVRQADAQ